MPNLTQSILVTKVYRGICIGQYFITLPRSRILIFWTRPPVGIVSSIEKMASQRGQSSASCNSIASHRPDFAVPPPPPMVNNSQSNNDATVEVAMVVLEPCYKRRTGRWMYQCLRVQRQAEQGQTGACLFHSFILFL